MAHGMLKRRSVGGLRSVRWVLGGQTCGGLVGVLWDLSLGRALVRGGISRWRPMQGECAAYGGRLWIVVARGVGVRRVIAGFVLRALFSEQRGTLL